MGFKFDSTQSAEFAKFIANATDKAVQKALFGVAMRVVATIQNEVIPSEPRVPVDKGLYRAAWKFKKIPKGAVIYNSMPYASAIEYGVRPGHVKPGKKMRLALEEWIVRKGIGTKEDAPGIAWAMAISMNKKGIFNGGKGLHILKKGMKSFSEFLQAEFAIEFKKSFEGKASGSK